MLRLCVCVLLLGQALGHAEINPLNFIRRDRASVKLEKEIAIQVNTSELESSGSWVNVSWSGVPSPDAEDWIGVYSPPVNNSIDPASHAPVKYQYARANPTHLKEGRGFLLFRLVNMRAPIIMGFLRGGFKTPTLAAVSGLVTFRNWNEPLQAHLALTGDPTEIIVVWVTKNSGKPQVKWGTASGDYTNTLEAESSSYSASDMCGSPATDFGYRDPGLLHRAKLTGLQPGYTYYYTCGDDQFGWSQEFSFKGASPADPDTTTRVSAFGDMGTAERDDTRQIVSPEQPAINTTRLLNTYLNETDVVLHIGDIAYALGYAATWEEFFDQVQSVAATVPYMVCIGNHERDFPDTKGLFNSSDSGGECGVPHERRFPMPRPALDQPWYGFDYGSAHFVLMSTEHFFDPTSPQYQFLDAHLKTVDRKRTPWLIFAGHRPMYIDSTNDYVPTGDQTVAKELRKYLESLLYQYKVDVAFWGHHHSYQRTCPVYQEKCTEGATTHIVIGMAGKELSKNVFPVRPSWIEYLDNEHWGMSRFKTNATTFSFEYIRDDDGQVHDTLVLKK